MRSWPLILFLIAISCGPTTIQKSGSQGVTVNTTDLITRILLQTNSPSSISTPSFLVQGNFLIGNTITLHSDSSCTSPIGEATAQNTNSVYATTLPLTQDGTYNIYATVTSRVSGTSGCSIVYATYEFETGSSPPKVSVLTPSGASFKPIVSLTDIQVGASILLYTESNCLGGLVGGQDLINTGFTQIQVTLPPNSQDGPYQFWALQTVGTKSICSAPSNAYVLNTKPGYVSVLNPSPGLNLRPTIRVGNGDQAGGALVPGALVDLYLDSPDCSTSSFVGTKQAGSTEISVDITINDWLPSDGNYQFYATQSFFPEGSAALRTSPCSLVYGTYQLKTSPIISLTSPTPSMNPFPDFKVSGMIPNWKAEVFLGSGCGGPSFGSAISSGQEVNVRLSNPLPAVSGRYYFSAKQSPITPRAGLSSFESSCSDVSGPYDFQAPKVFISTPSPGNIISPTIVVTELDANASNTVSIFPSIDCTGTAIISTDTLGSFSISQTIPSGLLPIDGLYSFSANQSIGNTNCLGAATYLLETKPAGFIYITPNTSTGNIATPIFSVSNIASYATPTVTVHQMNDCSDLAVGTAPGTFPTINIQVTTPINSEGLKTFYFQQAIPGHTPKCSQGFSYTYNITPSQVALVGPTSGNDPSPIIQVGGILSGVAGLVEIYRGNTTCETFMGSAPSPATGTTVNVQSIDLPTSVQGAVKYFAKQIINGVTSNCSTAFTTYNIDTYLTSIKIMTISGPQSVATGTTNIPSVEVSGFANDSTVQIFSDANCSTGTLMGSAPIPATNTSASITIISNPLNTEGSNFYYGRQLIGAYIGPCSGGKNIFATYNLNSKPEAPTLLTASPGTTLTPTVQANNIIPGALIQVFSDNICSVPLGSATSSSTQVNVTVSAGTPLLMDGVYYFYIRQINNGHVSPCSNPSAPYTLNTAPIGISVVTTPYELLPEPKWNIINPTIQVSGVTPGANVVLYKDENCTQVIGSTVPTSTLANIVVENGGFPTDGKYPLYTRQSYGGHTSYCTGNTTPIVAGEYNLVTKPTLAFSTPSPNNLLKPSVGMQNTVTGAFLQLYKTPSCDSGSEVSNIYISTGGNQILEVDQGLTVNGLNQIYGRQVIPLSGGIQQSSPCSENLNYQLSSAPLITLSSTSPSSVNTPSFFLSNLFTETDIGTKTVALYSDAGCTTLASPSTSITGASMTVTVDPITRIGTSTFYAKQEATNPAFVSPCSVTGANYIYDLAPAVSMVTTSPNDILAPTLRLSNVVAGATVTIFEDSSCSDSIATLVSTATTIDFTLPSDLPADGPYKFYANQALGTTVSECSITFGSYDLDTTNFNINPAVSGGTDTTPDVIVSSIDPGNIITLYADANCSQVMSGPVTAAGTSVSIASNPISTFSVNHRWWAKRQMTPTFTSPCAGPSGIYVLNIMPSSISVVTPSPGTDLTPTFRVGGVNNNSTVTLFSDGNCSAGSQVGVGVTGPSATTVDVTVSPAMTADGALTVWARQLSNGNQSSCSTVSATYVLDTDPKTLTIVSAGNSNPTPIIRVTGVEPGATVNLYVNDPNCNSTVMGLATVPGNASSTDVTSYPLSSDGTYTYFAKQFYPDSTFVSGCSSASVVYSLNSAPTALKLLSTNPTSAATPKILVEGVSSGDWVYLFLDPNCNFPSGSNISLGSSVQIQTLPALTASDTYSYFAKRIQGGGQGLQSACSTASVNLDYDPAFFSKWQFTDEISKNPPAAGDDFGFSVSTVNNYAVVGAPGVNGNKGAVYLYSYSGYVWNYVGTLTNASLSSGDNFGFAVNLFAASPSGNIQNGDLLIVGAPGDGTGQGKAFVYTYSNGNWTFEQTLNPAGIFNGSKFGASVAVSNIMAVVGAPNANSGDGTFKYFPGSNGVFSAGSFLPNPTAIPVGSRSEFGFAVSIFGTNFAISAPKGPGNQVVQFYLWKASGPVESVAITFTTASNLFGYSVDISGSSLIVGAPGGNFANIYSFNVSGLGVLTYNLSATLNAPVNAVEFGQSVSISSNTTAVVGSDNTSTIGSAWIYAGPIFSNTNRVDLPKIFNNANDQFGIATDIFGGSIIVGAPGAGAGGSAGASLLYRNDQ
jgi:hypothetical protein